VTICDRLTAVGKSRFDIGAGLRQFVGRNVDADAALCETPLLVITHERVGSAT
jgi:hypothetical protein